MAPEKTLAEQYGGRSCTFNDKPAIIIVGESDAIVKDHHYTWETVRHIMDRCGGRFTNWNASI